MDGRKNPNRVFPEKSRRDAARLSPQGAIARRDAFRPSPAFRAATLRGSALGDRPDGRVADSAGLSAGRRGVKPALRPRRGATGALMTQWPAAARTRIRSTERSSDSHRHEMGIAVDDESHINAHAHRAERATRAPDRCSVTLDIG